jgi:hypothetical protein
MLKSYICWYVASEDTKGSLKQTGGFEIEIYPGRGILSGFPGI